MRVNLYKLYIFYYLIFLQNQIKEFFHLSIFSFFQPNTHEEKLIIKKRKTSIAWRLKHSIFPSLLYKIAHLTIFLTTKIISLLGWCWSTKARENIEDWIDLWGLEEELWIGRMISWPFQLSYSKAPFRIGQYINNFNNLLIWFVVIWIISFLLCTNHNNWVSKVIAWFHQSNVSKWDFFFFFWVLLKRT